MTAGTQPGVVIEHGQVEAALKSLAHRQITCLWGRMVFRLSEFHWSVEGGPPLQLLRAIDRLMSRRPSHLVIRSGERQDSGID